MRGEQKLLLIARCVCLSVIIVAGSGFLQEARAGFIVPGDETINDLGNTGMRAEAETASTPWSVPQPIAGAKVCSDAGVGSEMGNTVSQGVPFQAAGISNSSRFYWMPAKKYVGVYRERVQGRLGFLLEILRPPKA